VVTNVLCAVFALSLRRAGAAAIPEDQAGRRYLVRFAGALASRHVAWTPVEAVLLNAVVFPVIISLGERFSVSQAVARPALTTIDLA
jgi:hypothetical protein